MTIIMMHGRFSQDGLDVPSLMGKMGVDKKNVGAAASPVRLGRSAPAVSESKCARGTRREIDSVHNREGHRGQHHRPPGGSSWTPQNADTEQPSRLRLGFASAAILHAQSVQRQRPSQEQYSEIRRVDP